MKDTPYFEGWYCKCRSCDGRSLALIPAFHKTSAGTIRASLQVITEHRSWWIPIPSRNFCVSRTPWRVRFGNNFLSLAGLSLNLKKDGLNLQGTLRFGPISPLQSPIMGPFRFLPKMECAHSVLSMSHTLTGSLSLNGERIDFTGGTGYLESDRGRSFPQSYLWTQCSWDGCSLMLALASIPLVGFSFSGCICAILLHGREFRLATYKGVKIVRWTPELVELRQGRLRLLVELLHCEPLPLRAPVSGRMNRVVRESLRSSVRCRLWESNVLRFDQVDSSAGFESDFSST